MDLRQLWPAMSQNMPTTLILGVSGIILLLLKIEFHFFVENVWSFPCTLVYLLGHRDDFIFVYELI
jgi:hypothetical protein